MSDKSDKSGKLDKSGKPSKSDKSAKGVKDMKTIVVFNQKGGVGKTSTVINLMSEFESRGKKVLAIDLDAQCNLSAFCGVREPERSVLQWLLQSARRDDVVVRTKYGDLIPAEEALQLELLRFASIPAFVIRLRDLIADIPAGQYDYILVDCPPTVNQLTAAALVAADHVLIPTEAEYFSVAGVGKIAETVEQILPLNAGLKALGVVLVKYNHRRVLTRALEDRLVDATNELLHCGVLDTRIRFTVDIPAAQATGLSAREYKPSGKAAQDYAALADEILKHIGEENER